jgi:hypothetical protein
MDSNALADLEERNTEFLRKVLEVATAAEETAKEAQGRIATLIEVGEDSMRKSQDRIAKIVQEAEASLKAVQQATANTGVGVHELHFADEVKQLATSRSRWLLAACALVLSALAAAGLLTRLWPPSPDVGTVVQLAITKVFIVGALAAAGLWCGSVYKARPLATKLPSTGIE